MNGSCAAPRAAMIPYVRGELKALALARVESHLGHCAACAALRHELAVALAEARAFVPEVDAERLQYLVAGLAPYVEARQGVAGWRLGVAGLALASAGLVLVLSLLPRLLPQPSTPSVAPKVTSALAPAFAGVPLRFSPSPFVRMLAAADWDGNLTQDGRRTHVSLERGAIAMSFVGGQGRRVRVVTPAATVEVVGTRFFVEAQAHDTVVGVRSGRVRVSTSGTSHLVAAGETLRFTAAGSALPASAPARAHLLDDPFLDAVGGEGARGRPRDKIDPSDPPRQASVYGVLDQLAKAQELALQGQHGAAVTIYESCVEDAAADYDAYRDRCRYELARLLGFARGEHATARRMLSRLAAGAMGEVRRQATLALCELDLANDPCGAAFCLGEVVQREPAESEIRREALRLIERWSVTARCGEAVAR